MINRNNSLVAPLNSGIGHTSRHRSRNDRLADLAQQKLTTRLNKGERLDKELAEKRRLQVGSEPMTPTEAKLKKLLDEDNQKSSQSEYEKLFTEVFDNIPAEFDYQPEWANGTGYLDGLVHAKLGLPVGDMATTVDDKDRRVIVVVTPVGNLVIFERYSPGNTFVVVSNRPRKLEQYLSDIGHDISGRMNKTLFTMMVGADGKPNVGKHFERVLSSIAKEAE